MDEGPGTDPGSLGFYVSVWIVMMAAMMLPSAAPMVVVHSAVQRRRREIGRDGRGGWVHSLRRRLSGCLGGVRRGGLRAIRVAPFARHRGPRVEPRRPLRCGRGDRDRGGLPADSAQRRVPCEVPQPTRLRGRIVAPGRIGAARMGIEHGAWCVGCCWALMATLFALGLMSITWTVAIAAVIALEKLLPWGRRQPRLRPAVDRDRTRRRARTGRRARPDHSSRRRDADGRRRDACD